MRNRDKKKILVICFSHLHTDPRVHRQLIFLKDLYEVTAAGFGRPGVDGVEFIRLEENVKRKNLKGKIESAINLKT